MPGTRPGMTMENSSQPIPSSKFCTPPSIATGAHIALCSSQQDSAVVHSVNDKSREDIVRTKTLFVASIAIATLAAPLCAQARPFEDPRADRIAAIDADAAFQAEPR